MGRGRNGPMDQSLKKSKIMKNKVRSGVLDVIKPKNKQQYTPLSLSEGLLAEMKQMNPQNLMNILWPNNVNRDIRGGLWGALNTTTPQKKLTNTASPQENLTKYRHRNIFFLFRVLHFPWGF